MRKIHDAYHHTPKGEPLVPSDVTAGALYLLRNPLDVAVSYSHHRGRPIDDTISRMSDEDHCLASSESRLPIQLRQRLGSWSSHVASWVDCTDFPVHPVRYEDMHSDAFATFETAARFAKLPHERGEIEKAIELCSFEELQRQERSHGFREKSAGATAFFREGRVGSWRDSLTEEQAARVISDHSDMMRRFGYLDENGDPV